MHDLQEFSRTLRLDILNLIHVAFLQKIPILIDKQSFLVIERDSGIEKSFDANDGFHQMPWFRSTMEARYTEPTI